MQPLYQPNITPPNRLPAQPAASPATGTAANPTQVVIDRLVSDNEALTLPGSNTASPVISTNNSVVFTGTSLGQGIVKYETYISQTGSAQNTTFQIPRPHRLLRVEMQLLDNLTNGGTDNFIGQVSFGRIVSNNAAATNASLNYQYFSTNGTPNETNNIVFVAGAGYENDNSSYVLTETGNSIDYLLLAVFVQYL